jgi:hypothetical protein
MENHLSKHMYTAGGSVKLIVYQQGPEDADSMLNSSPANESGEVTDFYVSTGLLRNASPVFASMLDGPWKESGEEAITTKIFKPDAFRVFLDCIQHLANDTTRAGDALIFTPSVIRKVLPIAHFFQVDVLKQQIISTVMEIMRQYHHSEVTDPRFINAAELMFAVEANIPETEIPDWPGSTLQQVARLMLDCSATDGTDSFGNRMTTATIKYKPNNGINDLSKKTVKKCFQSLSVQIKHQLPDSKVTKVRRSDPPGW